MFRIKKDIINHFIANGNDTISELSKELDLSVPTVTKFIGELIEQGLICEYGKMQTSGGRYPQCLRIKSHFRLFCGGRHGPDII